MRLLILFLLPFYCFSQTTIKITGKVTTTRSYCGGAAPTEEIIKQYNTPAPIKNKTFYIRKTYINDPSKSVYKKVKTDSNGVFTVSLPEGEYSIVDEKKKDKKYTRKLISQYKEKTEKFNPIDKPCIYEWLKSPDAIFNVKNDQPANWDINYHLGCEWQLNPCLQYIGRWPQ